MFLAPQEKENIFCGEEEKQKRKRKRRKIYSEGENICLWRRRKTEKEKEENIWTIKIIFAEEKENGEGKGGKYIGEGKIVAGWDGQVEGCTRGPRGPKNESTSQF